MPRHIPDAAVARDLPTSGPDGGGYLRIKGPIESNLPKVAIVAQSIWGDRAFAKSIQAELPIHLAFGKRKVQRKKMAHIGKAEDEALARDASYFLKAICEIPEFQVLEYLATQDNIH